MPKPPKESSLKDLLKVTDKMAKEIGKLKGKPELIGLWEKYKKVRKNFE